MMLMHRALRGGNPVASDVTAPTLSSAVGTTLSDTTATVGATTNEANGTLYVAVTTSATQPSIAQIKAGQNHLGAAASYASSQAISSTGAKTFTATGLTASTAYYAHLVHTDAAANDSNRLSSSSFTTDSASGALFSDDFSSGDLSHTENGVSWGSSIRASVIGGVLNMPWPGGTIETEQRFSFGATQYLELWIKYDIYVSASYNHQSGNNKGHIMLWSNSTGSKPNDGYGANDEMLMSLELNPHSNGDGGSFGAPRYQSLDAGGGVIVDVNASSEAICPNLITVSDLGQWRTIVQHIKAATSLGGSGPPTVWADTSDGAYEVWKDGTNILRRTTLNLFQEPGWAGFNRGYLFGARNGSNPVDDYINIDNFVISTTNIFGVS